MSGSCGALVTDECDIDAHDDNNEVEKSAVFFILVDFFWRVEG